MFLQVDDDVSSVKKNFALLWGPGAYDVYNAKMQKNATSSFGTGVY